jgi:L-amino acid N-acyltransferase YncA
LLIRPAEDADAEALAAIYGHHVAHGVGTFEEIPPSAPEMAARLNAVRERGLPYVVMEIEGRVAALAYAAPFRLRAAYRYTVEDSVYVASDRLGQGLGRAALGAVVEACEALGLHEMVAVIGGSGNAGSIGVHRACGFAHAGVLSGVGFKAGGWVDVVLMQRALNGGVLRAPLGGGLDLMGG